MGFVAIMFIGQVEQRALGIHPHLSQLLIRHPTFLCFHQLLIGTGPYGDASPALKLEIVDEQVDTGITSQHVIGKLKPPEFFQATNGKSCFFAKGLHNCRLSKNLCCMTHPQNHNVVQSKTAPEWPKSFLRVGVGVERVTRHVSGHLHKGLIGSVAIGAPSGAGRGPYEQIQLTEQLQLATDVGLGHPQQDDELLDRQGATDCQTKDPQTGRCAQSSEEPGDGFGAGNQEIGNRSVHTA